MSIRVLIVDDHAVVRTGLRLLLDAEDDLEPVGEAGNARDAVFQARALKPDVAARPRRECLTDVARFVLHREDEHLHIRALVHELGKDVEAGLLRHDDVEQNHVRLQRPRLEDRIAGVARLAHRLEVVLRVEQESQASPNHGVVVDYQHAEVTSEEPPPRSSSRHLSGTRSPAGRREARVARASRESRWRPRESLAWSKPAPSSSITAATPDARRESETLTL